MKKNQMLLGVALGAGLFFTGCIENKESDGVKAIREAVAAKENARARDLNADAYSKELDNIMKEFDVKSDSLLEAKTAAENQLALDKELSKYETEMAAQEATNDENLAKAQIKAIEAGDDVLLQMLTDYGTAYTAIKGLNSDIYDAQIDIVNENFLKGVTEAYQIVKETELAEKNTELTDLNTLLATAKTAITNDDAAVETLETDSVNAAADLVTKQVAKEKAIQAYENAADALIAFRDKILIELTAADFDVVSAAKAGVLTSTYAALEDVADKYQARVDAIQESLDALNDTEENNAVKLVYAKKEEGVYELDTALTSTINISNSAQLNEDLDGLNDNLDIKKAAIVIETEKQQKLQTAMSHLATLYNTYNTAKLTTHAAYRTDSTSLENAKRATAVAQANYDTNPTAANQTALTNAQTAQANAATLVDGVDGNEVPVSEKDTKVAYDAAIANMGTTATDYENSVTAYEAQVDVVDDLTNKIDDTDAITSQAEIQADIDAKNEEIAAVAALVADYQAAVTAHNSFITAVESNYDSAKETTLLTAYNTTRIAKMTAENEFNAAKDLKQNIEAALSAIKTEDDNFDAAKEVIASLEKQISTKETEITTLEKTIFDLESSNGISTTVDGKKIIQVIDEKIAELEEQISKDQILLAAQEDIAAYYLEQIEEYSLAAEEVVETPAE